MRRLIFEEKYEEADELCKQMQGPFKQSYMTLGNLLLAFDHQGEVSGYRRELKLAIATVRTTYQAEGTTFAREVFASAPDQAIVMRLTCDQPGQISFTVTMDNLLRHSVNSSNPNRLDLLGKCPLHVEPDFRCLENLVIYADDPDKERHGNR